MGKKEFMKHSYLVRLLTFLIGGLAFLSIEDTHAAVFCFGICSLIIDLNKNN